MAEDADDGEDHTCEIAVGVPYEDAGGVPVVVPQRERDADERKQEVDGEEVGVCGGAAGRGTGVVKREDVVGEEEQGDEDGLGDFDAVDAGEDVDAVGAEDGDGGHVGVVEPAEVD